MKVALVDDWCSVGSCNFDRWNQRWNLEANQEIIDTHFTAQIQHMLLQDFEHCTRLELSQWQKRGWLDRCREFFWSKLGITMEQFIND